MSFSEDHFNHCIVFDTNKLYMSGKKGFDFCDFKLNNTFYNVIEIIERLDMITYIKLLLPSVVWGEIRLQVIDIYNKHYNSIKKKLESYKFPNLNYKIRPIDYEEYIESLVNDYKENLKNSIVTIEELDLVNSNRFSSIVERAINKRPPFEGKEKRSDKGFKDTLIWESILEYKEKHLNSNIYFYTNDNMFAETLNQEYYKLFKENVEFLNNEEQLKGMIELLAIKLSDHGSVEITSDDDIGIYRHIKNVIIDEDTFNNFLYNWELRIKGKENYDFSRAVNIRVKEITNDSKGMESSLFKFDITIVCDMIFSFIYKNKCEDIELKNEEIDLTVMYNVENESITTKEFNIFYSHYDLNDYYEFEVLQ